MTETQLFSSECDNHSILHQTEKYFAKKNLYVIQFFRHTTLFYNIKTEISKPNEKKTKANVNNVSISFFKFRSFSDKKNSQDGITKSQANKIANTVIFVNERDQHNDLAISDCFTLQNLCKFYYFIAFKIPKMHCNFP